jgi:ATP/maltotriose-dependent transcriptional regulator MalT
MHRWRIYRERVVERIRRSKDNRVLLLLADAGFGKSVAVQQFLQGEQEPYAFYRVAPDTTTLLGFLRGLTTALDQFVPGAHLSFTMAYERSMQSQTPFGELATWLGEHLRDATMRIVIDDLHNAGSDDIGDFLAHAIDASPRAIKWLIATRSSKAFSPSTWLAQREMDWPIDDSELRFTSGEVAQLAQNLGMKFSPRGFDAVLRTSDGWPSAAALALLTAETLPALQIATSRLDVYDVLAQLVFDAQTDEAQRFLLETSVFSVIERDVLEASGWHFQGLADAPGWDGPYIEELSDGTFRYDSLFRDFLTRILADKSPEERRDALIRAAVAYERLDRIPEALEFHGRAKTVSAMTRLLSAHGFALIERGETDAVETAINALPEEAQHASPAILGLRGVIDSQSAQYDTAEAWFRLALHDLHDIALRLNLIYRYSLDLVRRGRTDCIELLEPAIATAEALAHELHPVLCCTLATAYVQVERLDEAQALLAQALPNLGGGLSESQRARAYHQAAFVALRCADVRNAANYATAVVEIATPAGLYDLAARAYSILYEIAHVWDAVPRKALQYVEQVASFALRCGDSQVREWALIAAYYIEAERGNGSMMLTIERSLNTADVLQMPEAASEALLPGQSLRSTWTGDFAHAYGLLARSAPEQGSADRRALRWAEIALYAAASGRLEEAREATDQARLELADAPQGKYSIQALAFALLTLSMLGDADTWVELRRGPRLRDLSLSLAALIRCVDLLNGHWAQKRDHAGIIAALDNMRRHDLGGLAAMLEALPAHPPAQIPPVPL